jgi:hypothetical protein
MANLKFIRPIIRTALTADGDIEAAFVRPGGGIVCRVVVDRRTGDLLDASVQQGSDEFRWLIRAARKHVMGVDDMLASIAAVHGDDDGMALHEMIAVEQADKAKRRGVA